MTAFAALGRPDVWATPLLWQAVQTVAGLVLALVLAAALYRLLPVRPAAATIESLAGYVPALALVTVPAVALGGLWWPWLIGLAALAATPGLWATGIGAAELPARQRVAAEAMDLHRPDLRRLVSRRLRRDVLRVLPAAWHRALAVTTMAGLLATAAGTEQPDSYGLGGLIAIGVRGGDYPPALAGAVLLVGLALIGEALLWLTRTVRPRPERHKDAAAI